MGRVLAATLALCALVAGEADAAPLTRLVGKPYDTARSGLVRAGYRIVRFQRGADFVPCPDDPSRCERYPEAINCSGTGLAFCQFAWFDKMHHRYLIIATHGEERRVMDSVTVASRQERSGWPREIR